MNSTTRRLVYSSILLAATTLSSYADPIRTRYGSETVPPPDNTFRTTGNLVLGSDITLSSLSDSQKQAVKNSFSNPRSGPLEGFSLFTPSTGKVDSIDFSASSPRGSAQLSTFADISTTDHLADTHLDAGGNSVTTPDTADQVVAEASAAISDIVDPENLSVATTTTPGVGPVSSAGATDGSGPIPIQNGPEPSSLVMAGSMFLASGLLGLFRRKRS